jgi:hypothetical protein
MWAVFLKNKSWGWDPLGFIGACSWYVNWNFHPDLGEILIKSLQALNLLLVIW